MTRWCSPSPGPRLAVRPRPRRRSRRARQPAAPRTNRRTANQERCDAPDSTEAGRPLRTYRSAPLPEERHDRSHNSTPFPALHRSAVGLLVLWHLDANHFMITEYFGRIDPEIPRDHENWLGPGVRGV